MYVKNRFRPGKPYFAVEWKDSMLQVSKPPEIWLCESGIPRNCTGDGCSRCGIDLIFVRLSDGNYRTLGSDRLQFMHERDATEFLMTWNEYVEACLFTWRGRTAEDVEPQVAPPAKRDDPLPKSVVAGLEKTTFRDLQSQCEGERVETVHVIGAKSSGFASACGRIPDLFRLHIDKTPMSCAELDPVSCAPSLRVLTMFKCPIVRSHVATNDRLTEDFDAEPHECLGRTCLTRSLHRLARTLQVLDCRDVKFRDQDIWGFDSTSSIERLSLAGSKITDQSARRLGAMRKLTFVDLSDSRISDETVIAICRNDQLEALNLDRTRVSDRIVDHLVGASKLRWLRIRGTNVSRDGLQRLRDECPDLRMHL